MTERPQITEERTAYTFWPGTQSLPAAVAPRVLNRPHSITADVDIPAGGAEGVLLCQGANNGGFTFYVKDGQLHYAHNYVRRAIYRVASTEDVPTGRHQLRFEFEPTGKPDFANGQGAPGIGPALRRRSTRRGSGLPGHHPGHVQPRRTGLRRQPRLRRRARLPGPVPVHRNAAQRHRRPQRRPHRRRRERDARGDGPPITNPEAARGHVGAHERPIPAGGATIVRSRRRRGGEEIPWTV